MFTRIALALLFIAAPLPSPSPERRPTIGIYGPYGPGRAAAFRTGCAARGTAPLTTATFRSAPARHARVPQGAAQDWFTIDVQDRASSPYAAAASKTMFRSFPRTRESRATSAGVRGPGPRFRGDERR